MDEWLPGAEVGQATAGGLLGTTALELLHDGDRYVAKAGDASDHHLAREIRGNREWLRPWTSRGNEPQLIGADEDAKLLLTRYLPGELVQSTDYEQLPDTYRQAGELLAQFHEQLAAQDEEFEAREQRKALLWLDKPHRIDADLAALLREVVQSWPTPGRHDGADPR